MDNFESLKNIISDLNLERPSTNSNFRYEFLESQEYNSKKFRDLYRVLRKNLLLNSKQAKNLLTLIKYNFDFNRTEKSMKKERGTYTTWSSGRSEILIINGNIVKILSNELFNFLAINYGLKDSTGMIIALKGTGPRADISKMPNVLLKDKNEFLLDNDFNIILP